MKKGRKYIAFTSRFNKHREMKRRKSSNVLQERENVLTPDVNIGKGTGIKFDLFETCEWTRKVSTKLDKMINTRNSYNNNKTKQNFHGFFPLLPFQRDSIFIIGHIIPSD